MGRVSKAGAAPRLGHVPVRSQSGKNPVRRLPRVTSADYVVHGVLKIVWDDGYEGVVDLRPVIDRGQIFTYLQTPENFRKVSVAEFGHSIGWVTDAGEGIDFDSYNLRRKAENRARLQQVVADLNL
jgi:hypothetical protein